MSFCGTKNLFWNKKIGNKGSCSRKVELNKSSGTNHRAHLRLHFQASLETIKPNIRYFINFILDLSWESGVDRDMVLQT